ncbi:hypothetical protein KR009_008775 [Drosophila setifemur]|nr:hypothetical protein KR009_008775 [Drosophila setifemur]
MFSNLDLSSLSVDDIVEEYKLLHDRHQQLRELSEQDAQRIHELKRNLDTALAAEAYLTQELEHLSNQPVDSNSGLDPLELEELRRKFKNLQAEQETLQLDYEHKAEEVKKLTDKLERAEKNLADRAASKTSDPHEDCVARLNALELENCELMQKLSDYEDSSVKNTFSVAEKEKAIECLQDQVSCLEQNLHCKRDELEEKLQLLESCQEQLVDANAKIALLTSAPENNDRKGNSLFAEVDDQRQVMKQLLAAQKKSYLDMKKTFTESQFEIRRLKRENVAMHTELQACSTIFCSADKTYQNKLNERIRHLMAANDGLERQLNVSQERLRELASEKSVTWLDSMLDFCKRETDELKAQLHSMRIQKAGLEEQVRSVQQEMARWRFESLKSRCVLIDRENLLTEHKIGFKLIQAMEFNIKEAELKAALPRIVSVSTESPLIAATTPSTSAPVTSTPETGPQTASRSACPSEEVINIATPIKPIVEAETVQITPVKVKQEPALKPIHSPIKTLMGIKIKREVQGSEEKTTESSSNEEAPLNLQEEFIKAMPKPELNNSSTEAVKTEANERTTQTDENQNEDDAEDQRSTETPVKPLKKGTPIKARLGAVKVKSDEDLLFRKETPAKPQRKGTPIKLKQLGIQNLDSDEDEECTPTKAESIQILDSPTPQKPQRKGTPVRNGVIKDATNSNVRSILCKKREIFAEDSHKIVQFSASDPIIHNLSPVERLLKDQVTDENEKPVKVEDTQDVKPTIKRPNIIRRIVVSSRKPMMK